MPPTPAVPLPPSPPATWKALAPLIAARPKIRVWDPATNKFDRTKNLTNRLPTQPAAVMLYSHHRTQVLALDFDTKHHSQQIVDADFARALSWITDAGGVAVTDRSTSGGRHIIVPLAIGTAATTADINPLMRLLQARLPSLDKTPMANTATGCITAPGSPCREGGHRILDGPLATAVDAFTTRSDPALLPRLNVLLGALSPTPTTTPPSTPHDATTGSGAHERLRPEYTRETTLPTRITTYATTGQLPADRTWRSHSEARQSVLAHAALHGHTLAAVQALMTPGRPWHTGLATAYTRYGATAEKALQRDWRKALTWAATNSHFFRPVRAQEQVHTGGTTAGPQLHREWLANAVAWVETQFSGHRYRWIGAAVYQALAIQAVRAGEVINGVPVVGVGGRALSLATGLLSETTVWEFLRETRDLPGSPLVRTRIAQGREPDYYALTQQNQMGVTPETVAATRVEGVHHAWKVIGHRHRRIYELIVHQHMQRPAAVFAAAHTATTTGYDTLTALRIAGLISHHRGRLSTGPATLDDIAAAHHLEEQQTHRIHRHQQERARWHTWLLSREQLRHQPATQHHLVGPSLGIGDAADRHHEEYLSAVLATGPPPIDEETRAIELLADLVGARVLTAFGS
ncbi:hypothetical protein [Mycobacterium intracellulare]|uniref:hypothetical protein n=1 Tax=Mycobacterium intracellulare TaxID=1767 RepID=UPI000C79E1D1|nr:hypothetical protein [Mycobacterium intracellulare]